MQLDRARRGGAPIDDRPLPADPARIAATLVVLGTACQIFRLFMPWVEKIVFSISLAKFDVAAAAVVLAALAVAGAGIAIFMLLQPPPTAAVATILIVLGLAQLGLALWHGFGVIHDLNRSEHIWADAIGTGIYLGVIGAVSSLGGGMVAWSARAPARAGGK